MTAVSLDKCELLPRFTFCYAPSLTQRVEHLRAISCVQSGCTNPGQSSLSVLLSDQLASQAFSIEACSDRQLHREEYGRCDAFDGHTADSDDPDQAESPTQDADTMCAQVTRSTSWSAGAVGHSDGSCQPCAWNWKRTGCNKGASCRFCHLCDEGMVKYRRKEKLASVRAVKAGRPRRTINTVLVPLTPGLVETSTADFESSQCSSPDTLKSPFSGTSKEVAANALREVSNEMYRGLL